MTSIFEAFGIDVEPGTPSTEPLLQQRTALENLQSTAAAQAMIRSQIPENFRDKVNGVYLNRLVERTRKTGRFAFLCARCWKAIHDAKKLSFDEHIGVFYGNDCHAVISSKQHALRYHYGPGNAKRPASPDELESFHCDAMDRDFQALRSNMLHCGPTPRTCAACPGTAVRNKHLKCDFEQAIARINSDP